MNKAGAVTIRSFDAKVYLTLILIIGAWLRIWVTFFTWLPNMHLDSFEYAEQADALLAGGYTNYFPNGYPALIALARIIAGPCSNTLLLWINIAFSTLGIWLIYDIGNHVLGRYSISLTAAAILAVFPTQLNYVRLLMTEVPSAFFLLGGYFFYYRKQSLCSGIFFALAIFTRTNIAPIPLLIIGIRTFRDKKIPWRLLTGLILPLLFVGFYCYKKTGDFSIAGNNQINILYSITAKGDDVDFSYNRAHPNLNTSGKAMKAYIDNMLADPGEFISRKWANFWELWGFVPSSANGTRAPSARWLMGSCNFFMLVFGLAGWWLHRRSLQANLLFLPFCIVTLIHTILFALTRYTYPAEAFMILLGAAALIRIKDGKKVRVTP